MEFGLAAWGLREIPLEKQLKFTRDLGLKYLEMSIANYGKDALQPTSSDAEIESVKTLFARYGISPECGCTGNDFTGTDTAEQVAKVQKVIFIASKLGIRRLRIFAGFHSDSEVFGERFDTMLAALSSVQKTAVNAGVTLCVETHGGGIDLENGARFYFNSVTTRSDCWGKILETGVSMLYDPANLSAVGTVCPCGFFKRFRQNIRCIHLKDFRDVPGGIVPTACGEGRLDYTELMPLLRDYDGPALIEYELPGDVEDGMRRSLEFLKKNIL